MKTGFMVDPPPGGAFFGIQRWQWTPGWRGFTHDEDSYLLRPRPTLEVRPWDLFRVCLLEVIPPDSLSHFELVTHKKQRRPLSLFGGI